MYMITTTDQARRQLWQRLFGKDELPVLNARPRIQELPDKSALAYDLALRMLHTGDRARLAAHAARQRDWSYVDALRTLETAVSWPIVDHGDLELVTVDEKRPSPAFVLGNVLNRIGSLVGRYAH